jgi:TetR/AcrR family transcriptional regulator, fatty acid metabolism regulator protein
MVSPPRAPASARRQRRAVATRRRVYEAAMAEYGRVGLEAARVEDIVAAAGVSWGTFFHYFPAKEDVLLDAAAEVCRAYAAATQAGLEAGQGTETVLAAAFGALFRAAAEVTPAPALRGKMMLYVLGHPGRLTEFLGDDVAPPVPATTAVIAEGQLRGEVMPDEPAESLAVIVLYAVLFGARRGATIGRPPGSTPLNRLALSVTLRGMRPGGRGALAVAVVPGGVSFFFLFFRFRRLRGQPGGQHAGCGDDLEAERDLAAAGEGVDAAAGLDDQTGREQFLQVVVELSHRWVIQFLTKLLAGPRPFEQGADQDDPGRAG